MHDPRKPHLALVKRILQYIRGILDYGLQLHCSSAADLIVYSNVDWARCPNTHRSMSGYGIFSGDNLVSWSSMQQHTVSRSSAEAGYRGVANAIAKASYLHQLLEELHSTPCKAIVVYCDNISAVYLSTNPVQHQRIKHIEIDLHFICDKVAAGVVQVLHVPITAQYADIFTKKFPSSIFVEFCSILNVLHCG
jgi:hypothetical protein